MTFTQHLAIADSPDCCWICLQEGGLFQPCRCPRHVHKQCLASWQLHAAGTREEVQCRFCNAVLPDWKPVLSGRADPGNALPVVAVVYCGTEYRLQVQPTHDGLSRFRRQVEVITGVPFNDDLEVKFFCRSPSGYNLQLKGTNSLQAAIHCAAVTAAEREQKRQGQMQSSKLTELSGLHRPGREVSTDAEADSTAFIFEPDPQDEDIMRYWRLTTQAGQTETEQRRTVTAAAGSSSSSSDGRDNSTGSSTGSNSSSNMIDAMPHCCDSISGVTARNRGSSGTAITSTGTTGALATHSASSPGDGPLQSAQSRVRSRNSSRRRTLSVNLVVEVQHFDGGAEFETVSCLPFSLSTIVKGMVSWLLH